MGQVNYLVTDILQNIFLL